MEARTNKLASETIELDVLTMQDLFGVADANLKLLERELGVSLITRDGQAVAVSESEEALALVRRNAELNGVADRVTTTCANVFDLARQYAAEGRQYGLVICDPPAFAKSRKVLESAYRGYKELNLQCMKLVRPGGFLVSCSCSQFMTPELFLRMLREAAQDAGRDARLLEPLMQSRDHPASLSSEQSLYLKGDILQIL